MVQHLDVANIGILHGTPDFKSNPYFEFLVINNFDGKSKSITNINILFQTLHLLLYNYRQKLKHKLNTIKVDIFRHRMQNVE